MGKRVIVLLLRQSGSRHGWRWRPNMSSFWGRLGRWLPVFFVLFLIGWCYSVFLIDILLKMLANDETRSFGTGYLIAFNVIFALAIASFMRAVFTDPRRIPDSWAVIQDDLEANERHR